MASLDRSEQGSFGGMQQRAFEMLTSPDVEQAFDLNRETPETRHRYGRHIHGQCLLRWLNGPINLEPVIFERFFATLLTPEEVHFRLRVSKG